MRNRIHIIFLLAATMSFVCIDAQPYFCAFPFGTGKNMRTVTVMTGKANNGKITSIDSLGTNGLVYKITSYDLEEQGTISYFIYYEYDQLNRIRKAVYHYSGGGSDSVLYWYNDAERSVTKASYYNGKWYPEEKYAVTEFGDTCLYLHFDRDTIANSGWKYEYKYHDSKISECNYFVYEIPHKQPTWKQTGIWKYYYSAQGLRDSIIRQSISGNGTGKSFFRYDEKHRLVERLEYTNNILYRRLNWRYNKKNEMIRYTETQIPGHDKKNIHFSRYKYNNHGLLINESYKEHGRWHTWSSYSYTYY